MVRIPDDAAGRLRPQPGGAMHPARLASAVPGDPPHLPPGLRFTAHIREALADGSFRAQVEGRLLTLSLPGAAQPGDALELVVVESSARGVVARRAAASPSQEPAAAAQQGATLSRAAQLIGSLLSDERPLQPTALNRGEPLLAQPPSAAAPLAQALAMAVRASGLFYESHQAQWASGSLPVEQLLAEPQGRHSAPATLARHGVAPESPMPAGGHPADGAARQAGGTQATIPEDLRPLVRQQFDAVATQRLVWHGEVWPGQNLDWEIEADPNPDDGGNLQSGPSWSTHLSLKSPRLGLVNASLILGAGGVRVVLAASGGASADELRDAAPALERSLAAAGLRLNGIQVRHDE